jgi:hypothetical protein
VTTSIEAIEPPSLVIEQSLEPSPRRVKYEPGINSVVEHAQERGRLEIINRRFLIALHQEALKEVRRDRKRHEKSNKQQTSSRNAL